MNIDKFKEAMMNCRFCFMCRHLSTIGQVRCTEVDTPRVRAAMLYGLKTGTNSFDDSDFVDALYRQELSACCTHHCVNHYDLTTVDSDTFIAEVQGLEDIFYTYFPDADPMLYFRPPSGAANEWVLNLADKMGYTTVLWSWAHRDFVDDDQPGHAETIQKIKQGLHNGCVYLLHPESTTNTAILGEMIDWIRSQGYEFLPLCDIETD